MEIAGGVFVPVHPAGCLVRCASGNAGSFYAVASGGGDSRNRLQVQLHSYKEQIRYAAIETRSPKPGRPV